MGFQVEGVGFLPEFSAPPRGETMRRPPNVLECKNVLEVFYLPAKFGGARISPAVGAANNVEFLPAALRAAQHAGI